MTEARPTGWIVRRGLGVVVLSLVANGVLLLAVRTSGTIPVFRPLSWGSVIVLTVIGAVGATLAFWTVVRFAADPVRTYRSLAVVFLFLSFVPDVTLAPNFPGSTIPGIVVLMAMHVIVAGIAIGLFTGD